MSRGPATPEEMAEVTGEADGVADGSAAGKAGRPKMHEEHELLHAGLANPGVGMRNLSEVVRSVMDISHGMVANMVKACVELGWLQACGDRHFRLYVITSAGQSSANNSLSTWDWSTGGSISGQ